MVLNEALEAPLFVGHVLCLGDTSLSLSLDKIIRHLSLFFSSDETFIKTKIKATKQ
ncbi:hypothetical protein YC2023_046286 [Brassica napus]